MRSPKQIKELILHEAETREDVLAVVLSGSRADHEVPEDDFQDYDITWFVEHIDPFTKNEHWLKPFGERIIMQRPGAMELYGQPVADENSFSWLMLFDDLVRIDLTVTTNRELPHETFEIWMDKLALFADALVQRQISRSIAKPDKNLFQDVCNEFWWVSTYVVKGLARNELLYAKDVLENVVRPMFFKMLAWQIGVTLGFDKVIGKSGKFIPKLIDEHSYLEILATYCGADFSENWNALEKMMSLFHRYARQVAVVMNFTYNESEAAGAMNYASQIKQKYCKA